MVSRGASRLNKEDILATDVFIYLYKAFSIGESIHRHIRQLNADTFCDALCQFSVCCTTNNLHTGNWNDVCARILNTDRNNRNT